MDATGISAIVSSILFVLIGVAYGHKLFTEGAFTSGAPVDLSFLSLLVLYLPNTLFAYGFIADLANGKYHYSVASITALAGMFINKFIGSEFIAALLQLVRGITVLLPKGAVTVPEVPAAAPLFTGTTADSISRAMSDTSTLEDEDLLPAYGSGRQRGGATDVCSLPGFEWLENKVAPQGIIMSMTVLWYLIIELWDTGAGTQSIAISITTVIVFLVQWLVLSKSGCLNSYVFSTWSVFTALLMSITFAGTSYGIQKQIAKYKSPSSNSPVPPIPSATPGTFVCPPGTAQAVSGDGCVPLLGPGGGIAPSGLGSSTETINVGGSNEKTQAVDDNDQFVCEAYKDGELVTSTIVE